jgi:PAS domain S-box-containing protein
MREATTANQERGDDGTAGLLAASSRLEACVHLDHRGRVSKANRAAEALLGLDGRRAPGSLLAELIAPPDSEILRELRSLLSSRSAVEEAHKVEVTAARENGRTLSLELWITRTSEPAGSVVWFSEATECRTTEAAVRHRLALMERGEQVAKLGSWEWCPETDTQVWSDNLYRLFGSEPGEITPTREWVLEQTHPDDRERMEGAVDFLAREGHLPPVEYRVVQPDQPMRRFRSTITAVEEVATGRRSIVGAVRDVTREFDAERKIAAHVAVSNALEHWESLEQGAHCLLRDLAEALEFASGTLWVPLGDALVARVLWTTSVLDAADFEAVTRRLRLGRGICLPGRVWATGEPINLRNIHEETSYGRGDAAARAGFHSAVAFPALHADELLAVLEFHSREEGELSSRLMRSFTAIGYELGQFLAHHRAQLHPVSLTRRQLEVIRLAAQGCSGREIADRLFISPTTVKSHFETVYAKFEVSDRTSAVAEAMRYGFIE